MTEKLLQFDTRKNIFFGAIAIIGLCVCMYIYFVTSTIRNIVILKQLTVQISDQSQKISTKEFNSINLKNNVTLQYAESLGFSEAKKKVFITPTSVSYISSNSSANSNAI